MLRKQKGGIIWLPTTTGTKPRPSCDLRLCAGAVFLVLAGLFIFIFSQKAFAQALIDTSQGTSAFGSARLARNFGSPQNIISLVFNLVIGASGAIFFLLLLVGGVRYLTAGGNEEATSGAKKLLLDALIGLVITISAWAIGAFALTQFGYAPPGSGGGSAPPNGPTGPSGPSETPTSSPSGIPTNDPSIVVSINNDFGRYFIKHIDSNGNRTYDTQDAFSVRWQGVRGCRSGCRIRAFYDLTAYEGRNNNKKREKYKYINIKNGDTGITFLNRAGELEPGVILLSLTIQTKQGIDLTQPKFKTLQLVSPSGSLPRPSAN